MKPAVRAKSRLSTVLDSNQRMKLSVSMFERVLKAATNSLLKSVVVLGGNLEIQTKAHISGALWRQDHGRGLNGELSSQIEENSNSGSASMYIPGDLALLTTKEVNDAIVASRYGTLITICPAFGDGGTNGLIVPSQSPMRLQLGSDSFDKHKAFADGLELPYAVVKARGFGLDLDIPDDLEELQRIEPGCLKQLLCLGGDEPC